MTLPHCPGCTDPRSEGTHSMGTVEHPKSSDVWIKRAKTAKPKERGIIFSAPMILALLTGKKTQTRRLVSKSNTLVDGCNFTRQKELWGYTNWWEKFDFIDAFVDPGPSPAGNVGPYLKVAFPPEQTRHRLYPIWDIGDRLWVREKHYIGGGRRVRYAATPELLRVEDGTFETAIGNPPKRWRSPIHMPQWASRITLEITGVRVERLCDISEEDARAEGAEHITYGCAGTLSGYKPIDPNVMTASYVLAKDWFKNAWKFLHGKDSWSQNLWVWVIQFKRVEGQ